MDVEWTMKEERTDGSMANELEGDMVGDADADLFNVFTGNAPQTPDSSIFISSDVPNLLSPETNLCANESDSPPPQTPRTLNQTARS
jgi:hypothetical protein